MLSVILGCALVASMQAKVLPSKNPHHRTGHEVRFELHYSARNPIEDIRESDVGTYNFKAVREAASTEAGVKLRGLEMSSELGFGKAKIDCTVFIDANQSGGTLLAGARSRGQTPQFLSTPQEFLPGKLGPGAKGFSVDTLGVPMMAIVPISCDGKETISTKAGRFETYRFRGQGIERKRSGLIDWNMTKDYTLWYSAEVGLVAFSLDISSDYAVGSLKGDATYIKLASGKTYGSGD